LAIVSAITFMSPSVQAQGVTPPPGGNAYFGSGANSTFNPQELLQNVKPVQAPAPAPVGNPGLVPPPLFGGAGNDPLLPAAEPPAKNWTGGAEFGINGATGNSDIFNMRLGWNARRKTRDNLLDTDFLYTFTRTDDVVTQQQAIFNARDEVLFAGTPWSVFGATNVEYDELRAYQFRIGGYAGVGYVIVDDARMNWRVRAGAGAVYEVGRGNLPNRWVPEAVLGSDFTYTLSERQSFVTVVDYYPRIDQWGQFRVRARAAYQILIDPENNLMLRLGVQDRYDSNPGNARRNDLNYFVSLGFSF
jgi:hypothetical protein